MSLRPISPPPVPDETVLVARAAFPRGTLLMRFHNEFGTVFDERRFAHLFPARGRPAEAPWRLAMVTLLQFAEGLSDRQAADAVRGRIDWKCLLGLPLADAGFDSTVLSEFRSRLVAGRAERLPWTLCWKPPPRGAWCGPAAGSARTPPTCSPPSGRSTGSSA